MKNLLLAVALVSSSAQAYDFREELSEGFKPNVETVEEDRSGIDWGIKPTEAHCQQLAMGSIGSTLKDSYSARYRFTACDKNTLTLYRKKHHGYLIAGFVNSKNSYGGYVGETRFDIFIRNGKVIGRCIAKAGRTECSGYRWEDLTQ